MATTISVHIGPVSVLVEQDEMPGTPEITATLLRQVGDTAKRIAHECGIDEAMCLGLSGVEELEEEADEAEEAEDGEEGEAGATEEQAWEAFLAGRDEEGDTPTPA